MEPTAEVQIDIVSEHKAQNTSSSSFSYTDASDAYMPPPIHSAQTSAPLHKRRQMLVPYNNYRYFGNVPM